MHRRRSLAPCTPSASTGSAPPWGSGRRRPAAVGGARPAVADRLRGHAARAAHHAGAARATATPRWWCPRLEAPRVVERPDVFAVRPWDETDDPVAAGGRAGRRRRRGWPSATAPGPGSWSTSRPSCRRRPWRKASDVTGPLRARQGRGRDRAPCRAASHAADRVAAQLQGGRDPAGRPDRGRGVGRHRPPAGRRGPPPGQLRHRRRRRERRQPPPRAGQPGHPRRRGGAVRLRRHHGRPTATRLLLRHHPLRVHRRAAGRGGRGLRRAPRGPAGRGRPRPRSARRARRSTPPPAASSPTPATATASSTAPATASASRSTRTPTSWPATPTALVPGHAFSVEPGIYTAGAWGMRLEDIVVAADAGPDPLNRADHALVVVDADGAGPTAGSSAGALAQQRPPGRSWPGWPGRWRATSCRRSRGRGGCSPRTWCRCGR